MSELRRWADDFVGRGWRLRVFVVFGLVFLLSLPRAVMMAVDSGQEGRWWESTWLLLALTGITLGWVMIAVAAFTRRR